MLGIDVSKATLTTALVDRVSLDPLWRLEVPNTEQGIRRLLGKTPAGVSLVVEPTGRYSHLIVRQAEGAGHNVLLAPNRRARLFLQSEQGRAKTDKNDSAGLARFGMHTKLRPYKLKSEAVDELGQLLRARRTLSDTLSRLKQQQAELPAAQPIYAPVMHQLNAQLKAADQQIASRLKTQLAGTSTARTAEALREVPGIGPVISAAVAACLSSKEFTHPDAFVAYLGLDVAVRQSGQFKSQKKLTKQGDAELRRLLYLGAKASVRVKTSPFRAQFEHERAKGLKKTGAYCAVARKMARLCWSLHKHGTCYDPARVGQSPHPSSPPSSKPSPKDVHQDDREQEAAPIRSE